MREDRQSQAEKTSAEQARIAAQSAVSSVQRELDQESSGNVSKLALYTWGSLAVFCTFFAATSLVIPMINGTSISVAEKQPAGTTKTASGDARKLQQKTAAESSVDPLTTGALGKTDRLSTNVQEAAASPADPSASVSSMQSANEGDVFGVQIGISKSVPELVERYRSFSRRAPDLFSGKKGRVRMAETNGQLQAQLIAGPFKTAESVALFCRTIRLKLTADCSVAVYGGERIK